MLLTLLTLNWKKILWIPVSHLLSSLVDMLLPTSAFKKGSLISEIADSPIIKQQWQQGSHSVGEPGWQALLLPWSGLEWAKMFGVNTVMRALVSTCHEQAASKQSPLVWGRAAVFSGWLLMMRIALASHLKGFQLSTKIIRTVQAVSQVHTILQGPPG